MEKLSERFMFYTGLLVSMAVTVGAEVIPEDLKHISDLLDAEEQGRLLMVGDFPDLEFEKQTNADRIRSMTDEELAEWLLHRGDCVVTVDCLDASCDECILKWLKSEVGCE